jgi:hypothetical protein
MMNKEWRKEKPTGLYRRRCGSLCLTHQGFIEDEYWSMQFDIRKFITEEKIKDAKEKLDKW